MNHALLDPPPPAAGKHEMKKKTETSAPAPQKKIKTHRKGIFLFRMWGGEERGELAVFLSTFLRAMTLSVGEVGVRRHLKKTTK
mgnify:CR=1 FL=1